MIGEAFTRLGVLLLRAIALLPLPVVRRIGESVGSLAWALARGRRRVALVNLRLCFPDWSEARRAEVAHAHFRCFMASFFERFIVWYAPAERIRAMVELRGIEHILAHRGRPVIVLAPHFVGIDAGGVRLQMEVGGS